MAEPSNEVFVSAASAWEIAIKSALARLAVPDHPTEWLPEQIAANRFTPLPIGLEHALAATELPTHHADPFDRLLVAQATMEQLAIVTGDAKLAAYDVKLVQC